uniref:class I SAM-dependent methyltransferase n=1 Tax=Acaryochloris sp. IP29b_bin.137 TaxID=2969217 RepID=UPI002612C525
MGSKLKPDWAGGDLLSSFINHLIQIKPIYAVMKYQARQVLIKTAEQNGIPWQQNYQSLERSGAKGLLNKITNPTVTYPDYYLVPFHAYSAGNLCWKAAFEAPSAIQSMALRVWPKENLSWQTAQNRLRHSFHQVLGEYGPHPVANILDMGCSTGISTRTLHQYYTSRQDVKVETVGLDLSPYMLAVAQALDIQSDISSWIHAQAEDTGLSDESFDVVTLQFVTHELPRQATRNIFQEIMRILRPGGCLALVDTNPTSPVIQNLPPTLFTLLKSTEPWSDDYYTFDME